ncbi:MAG: hypothetical protein QM775_29140 [Pirellulales bacterium]
MPFTPHAPSHEFAPLDASPGDDVGLLRDLPDVRDLTLEDPAVRETLRKLRRRRTARAALPAETNSREYLLPASGPYPAAASAAAAVATLVQYFERRTLGRAAQPSVGFLYEAARKLAGITGNVGAGLRTTLHALGRFGCPPERFCPTSAIFRGNTPDPFAFGFQRDYLELRYARLDPPSASGADVLKSLKACLAAGFAVACGAALPDVVDSATGDIGYPTKHDTTSVGSALVIVGYDDAYRVRSTKGALLVRAPFGPAWGEAGCGRLPYRYVEERLACDFWTIWKPEWLASGELDQPV